MSLMTKEWRFPELKALLGSGPWQNEPDKMQWEDETTGLACLIVRSPSMGALCGYVGVPEGHPWHGLNYRELDHLTVHGGITFTKKCHGKDTERGVCHVTEKEDNVWWIGFDCCQSCDLCPIVEMRSDRPPSCTVYRDIRYVINEVTSLAVQIAEGDNR